MLHCHCSSITTIFHFQGHSDIKLETLHEKQHFSLINYTIIFIPMEENSSKETILEQLRNGVAKFELVSTPVASISSYSPRPNRTLSSHSSYKNNLFFARIGGGGVSPAMKKVECYSVKKVTGDGRCLFRALVKGMAIHKGLSLNSREETENADELRTAVKEIICGKDNERNEYAEALMAITVDESLKRYCQRIGRSDFWGGESELLVLSKLCHQPIIVYIPEHEHAKGGCYDQTKHASARDLK